MAAAAEALTLAKALGVDPQAALGGAGQGRRPRLPRRLPRHRRTGPPHLIPVPDQPPRPPRRDRSPTRRDGFQSRAGELASGRRGTNRRSTDPTASPPGRRRRG
ncbi:hypothetical protein [Saccharothrix deserti]|uniref:hypothetical protein n=1 Tax=Saccharothrix deserti TaxID=2593674 RepID=UPI001EE3D97C|nr:hypothetical protein [Saccharothrix deserti]